MASISLCTETDIEDIITATAVAHAVDDNDDLVKNDPSETGIITRTIYKASAIVASKLEVAYPTADYQGSNPPTDTPDLVRYITAVIATWMLARRRRTPVGAKLEEEYQRVLGMLEELALQEAVLPGTTLTNDHTPWVSVFHFDGRFKNATIRRIPHTSTDPAPGDGVKHFPDISYPGWDE